MRLEETPCCALVFLVDVNNRHTARDIKNCITNNYDNDADIENGKVINDPFTTVQCVALQGETQLQKTLESLGFRKKLSFHRRKTMDKSIGNKMCYLYTVNYTTLKKSKV